MEHAPTTAENLDLPEVIAFKAFVGHTWWSMPRSLPRIKTCQRFSFQNLCRSHAWSMPRPLSRIQTCQRFSFHSCTRSDRGGACPDHCRESRPARGSGFIPALGQILVEHAPTIAENLDLPEGLAFKPAISDTWCCMPLSPPRILPFSFLSFSLIQHRFYLSLLRDCWLFKLLFVSISTFGVVFVTLMLSLTMIQCTRL